MSRATTAAATRRDATREAILAAAIRCFARDGYRRTALDRVAGEAGISRAALYLHFANKEQLFLALVTALHDAALAEAEEAARDTGPLADRLTAMLVAKTGRFFELLRASAHAEEFLDEHHRLGGDLSADAAAKHAALLARQLARANGEGEIALAPAGFSARQAAELLLDTAEGIKTRGRLTLSDDAYRERLGRAVAILVAGLTPGRTAVRRRSRRRAAP